MFNVYSVKPYSSVRRQRSVPRTIGDSATNEARTHDVVEAPSPTPRPPRQASTRATPTAAAASASPSGRGGQPRTVPSATRTAGGRPQAASQPTSALPPLGTDRHEVAVTAAAARTHLPRRVASANVSGVVGAAAPSTAQTSAWSRGRVASGSDVNHGSEEPAPSVPASQLPSHVRRRSGESRSPSGGGAGAAGPNPYASLASVTARASVVPPDEASSRRRREPQPTAAAATTTSQPHAPAPSALAAALEKEARVSRANQWNSPQRDGTRRLPDADTTLPHDSLGSEHGWDSVEPSRTNTSVHSEMGSVPRRRDFYDGTRGTEARAEALENLNRVLTSARSGGVSTTALPQKQQQQPNVPVEPTRGMASAPRQHSAATQIRPAGAVLVREVPNTPPRGHDVRRSKTGLAGATPWHGREEGEESTLEEADALPSHLAPQPAAPPATAQSENAYVRRVGAARAAVANPAEHKGDVAISPPRQELHMNRYARYVDQSVSAQASVERRRRQTAEHVSPVRILPESSPYRTRTSQPRHSPSPMRQPEWHSAANSVPREHDANQYVHAASTNTPTTTSASPHARAASRPEATKADDAHAKNHHGDHDDGTYSVTSVSTSASGGRRYRPNPAAAYPAVARAAAAKAESRAAEAVLPPPPAPPQRTATQEATSAWTAGDTKPHLDASLAADDLSSIASSLRQMKGQKRPSWRRLAPFFPTLEFQGRSDAQIVRDMEDALRIMSSPPKAPPPFERRVETERRASANVAAAAPQQQQQASDYQSSIQSSIPTPPRLDKTAATVPAAPRSAKPSGKETVNRYVRESELATNSAKTASSVCVPMPMAVTLHASERGSVVQEPPSTHPSERGSTAPAAEAGGAALHASERGSVVQEPPSTHPSERGSTAPAAEAGGAALHASERGSVVQEPPSVHSRNTAPHPDEAEAQTSVVSSTDVHSAPDSSAFSSTASAPLVPAPHTITTTPITSKEMRLPAPRRDEEEVEMVLMPVVRPAVKPLPMDRLRVRPDGHNGKHTGTDSTGTTPRASNSEKTSPRFFAPRMGAGTAVNRPAGSPTGRLDTHSSNSTRPRRTSTTKYPSPTEPSQVRAAANATAAAVAETEDAVVGLCPPQWSCGDAVEAVLLDAYMQLGDLESQYFRLDIETQEEIEDRVHVVELNAFGRVTGAPRRYLAKGIEQEVLPLLRYPETETIVAYDLSRQGFINLCAATWLTRFQSEQGIRDLANEMAWTESSPSASFSLFRQSYSDVGSASSRHVGAGGGGVIAENARAANMWVPHFNKPTDLVEQLDNLVNWAVRTWVEQQVPLPSTHGSPLGMTPFDASHLACGSEGSSAIARARRKGPPTSPRGNGSSTHRRTASLPSDGGLHSVSSDVYLQADPIALFCAQQLTDTPLHLDCWPEGIWKNTYSPSLVEHATSVLLWCVAPEYAEKQAQRVAAAAEATPQTVKEAQKTWNLFLGASQWNNDDAIALGGDPSVMAMPPRVARVAYSLVSRARTYNLTGGVGLLFCSFLTSQLPEAAFFDCMFLLEKMRLALVYSPLLTRASSSSGGLGVATSAAHRPLTKLKSSPSSGTVFDEDPESDVVCGASTVYDIALALQHFFPLKEPAALLVLYEALIEDLAYLGKLDALAQYTTDRRGSGHGGGDGDGVAAPSSSKPTTDLVDEWEELGTEDSASRQPASPLENKCPPAMLEETQPLFVAGNNNSNDEDDEAPPTVSSEAARAMLWAAALYADTRTVLPLSRKGTPAELTLAAAATTSAQNFHSAILPGSAVWELLSTPVPVETLFRYRMATTTQDITSSPSSRRHRVASSAVLDDVTEKSLLYDPPVGCKSHLVECVRLQYVCELLEYTSDLQQAILGAKRYESAGAASRLKRKRAELHQRAALNERGDKEDDDDVELGSAGTINLEASAGTQEDASDDAREINAVENVTSVRAVLIALQRADSRKPERDVQEYLRHLLVLYFSGHTVEDLFVDEEQPEEVELAHRTTADLSLQDWFEPVFAGATSRDVAQAKCDRVFVHIQELAGLCPRVLARRASTLDDPFAVEL